MGDVEAALYKAQVMTENSEDRIMRIEILLSEQDQLLQALNQEVVQQQDEIRVLKLQLEHAQERLKQLQQALPEQSESHQLPPHY